MALFRSIETGNIEALRNALDKDPSLLESKNEDTGLTLLATACQKDKLNIVELLLEKYKANVELKSSNGEAPIYAAIASGNEKMVKLLIDHNADVNSFDTTGKTPLIFACTEGELNIIKLVSQLISYYFIILG